MSMPPTPAGWYQDPEAPSHERWWDGTAWTPHSRVAQPRAGHGLAPADPAQQTGQQAAGQFGPPAVVGPAGSAGPLGPAGPGVPGGSGGGPGGGSGGGPGGRAKIVALAVAGVVLVASIVTGVVVLGGDDEPDPGATARTSPTAEVDSPGGGPEPAGTESAGATEPAGDDGKLLVDQLNGITLPIPEGWERPERTVEKDPMITTEGTYTCPGDGGFCHRGRVSTHTVRAGAGSDPEVAAKTDISEAAERAYDRDAIDRRPYNGVTSHSELKSERVVVAGSTGYLVRWRVRTEAGSGGYVQSVVFPRAESETLIVVRFAFDASDGPSLSLMDDITGGIRRIGDKGSTNGGVGSTIEP
ncbi:DUF2510 domain-containing protein [Streptomyces sp. KLOTTS4A1]|uniref:DUF2510 domain-containing protein n=1 Tax=Streptomyces sp. KLOTTS4A1 TaxID=3390996 RepID=UPI0039F55C56